MDLRFLEFRAINDRLGGLAREFGFPLQTECRMAAAALVLLLGGCSGKAAPVVEVAGIAGLMEAAAKDGQTIRMRPGLYRLSDFVTPESIVARRKAGDFPFLKFTGSRNTYQLDGVVIEWETELRAKLRPPVHTNEMVVSGSNNIIQGLAIRCVGDGTSPGGALISVDGNGNTLKDCRFLVRGSFPYGYGDVFGKGNPSIIGHHKHSGVRISGSDTKLVGCELKMESFGHGYFIQESAANVSFENCTVEGVMRSTDEMLAETEGPAFEKQFHTVFRNREGRETLLPGYMKSLSEDGFRTYSENTVTFKDCTAKHMRGGFELRTKQGVRLENCAAIGCERGFWVSDNAVLERCKGDARYGPLLFLEGRTAKIDLEVLPDVSNRKVHALATIHGTGHRVNFHVGEGGERSRPIPILIGYSTPPAGEGMAPIGERPARDVSVRNETSMPVRIGAQAERTSVTTRGVVEEDLGRETSVNNL